MNAPNPRLQRTPLRAPLSRKPLGAQHSCKRKSDLSRGSVAVAGLALLWMVPMAGSAQTCGFPWTVTATPAGGTSVAVTMCGLYTLCAPHNPQFTVNGSAINITLQTSEPPDSCMCIVTENTFRQTILVQPVPPGTYSVTVTLLSCSAPEVVGSTVFTQEAASTVPVVDPRGVVAFVVLVAIAGISVLRR
jgi:hypothetical protein